MAFVTVGGNNGGRLVVRSSNTWSGWNVQLNPNGIAPDPLGTATHSGIDYLAVKFSPTYASDSSIVVVYADDNASYYNIGFRDINTNTTLQWAFPAPGIEIKNPISPAGASPNWDQINTVDLHLPSDFSGQSASLRRAYISLDAYGSGGIDLNPDLYPNRRSQDGIYRIDDTTLYVLMDTSRIPINPFTALRIMALMPRVNCWQASAWASLHSHRAHLVHRLAHHLSHTLLVPGA